MKSKAKFLLLVVLSDLQVSANEVTKSEKASKRDRDSLHKKKRGDRTSK